MKLFRFISQEEFKKYINGKTLINTKEHNKENNFKTNSVGFCFFNYAHYKPEEILHSVTGIVDFDVCCVFETQRDKVRKSWGRYAKRTNSSINSFIATEYCTTKYSRETFKLLEYAIPDWFNKEKWKWIKLN